MSEETKTIEVSNLGPVKSLIIPLPTAGVIELRGSNGSGKSTVLAGVSKMLGGRQPGLSARDGTARGTVELGDCKLSVTKSRTSTVGELEITGIEGRLDVAALVDPGVADPAAADAKRLKALVSLSGVAAEPAAFHAICGGPEAFAAMGIEPTDDVLLLAARVKRALEAEARRLEKLSDTYRSSADTLKASIGDVDIDAPCDEGALADAYANAREVVTAMGRHDAHAAESRAIAESAAKQLAALASVVDDVDELKARANVNCMLVESHRQQRQKNLEHIAELQRANGDIEASIAQCEKAAAEIAAAIERAIEATMIRATLEASAKAAVPTPHTSEDIAAAEARIVETREAMQQGAIIRRAREQKAQADAEAARARDVAKHAVKVREKAAETDAVLSGMIPADCPLRYVDGRLVIATDRSPIEPFGELSFGERVKIGFDVAAGVVGKGGLITLPQEFWSELDSDNKALVNATAVEKGLVVLTASAVPGDITAEIYVAG